MKRRAKLQEGLGDDIRVQGNLRFACMILFFDKIVYNCIEQCLMRCCQNQVSMNFFQWRKRCIKMIPSIIRRMK